jgi:hypothetical protein
MIQDTGDYLTLWLLGLADFWLTPGKDAFLSGIIAVASSPGGAEWRISAKANCFFLKLSKSYQSTMRKI